MVLYYQAVHCLSRCKSKKNTYDIIILYSRILLHKSLGIAMGVFDLFRKVMAKEHPPADKNECERVPMEMKRRLQLEPLPNTGRIMITIANSKL